MQDSELEALLNRYRPADPPGGLEDRLLEQPALVFRDPRTWPWAVAAAALLAVTIGLHVAALAASSAGADPLDAQRVQVVAEQIDGPAARVLAEDIVRQEQRAEERAREWREQADAREIPR
jgi:hypothetical protein